MLAFFSSSPLVSLRFVPSINQNWPSTSHTTPCAASCGVLPARFILIHLHLTSIARCSFFPLYLVFVSESFPDTNYLVLGACLLTAHIFLRPRSCAFCRNKKRARHSSSCDALQFKECQQQYGPRQPAASSLLLNARPGVQFKVQPHFFFFPPPPHTSCVHVASFRRRNTRLLYPVTRSIQQSRLRFYFYMCRRCKRAFSICV